MNSARAGCTADCNTEGLCCTENAGVCQFMPCTGGCLFAWYAEDEAACVAVSLLLVCVNDEERLNTYMCVPLLFGSS